MLLRILRWFLLPISLIYGAMVLLRNWAYDSGSLRSTSFHLPVIVVGNLAVGGAGKSPMTEYLIRLFSKDYKMAVLSRGYGRITKGFRWVGLADDATLTGDEPLQFKQHFPELSVAVCEDRVAGVAQLKAAHDLIVLDDAYQHRALKPSLQILLFDYNALKTCDWLLPAGNLREPMCAKNRADMLVVTKSPKGLSAEEKLMIRKKLKPEIHQALFFSHLTYGDLQSLDGQTSRKRNTLKSQTQLLLLSGIANPVPLIQELKQYTSQIIHQEYPDHHQYTTKNMLKLAAAFEQMRGEDKLIVTTEKDAQRLRSTELQAILSVLPIYMLPVAADFEEPDKEDLTHLLQRHVRHYSTDHGVHPKENGRV